MKKILLRGVLGILLIPGLLFTSQSFALDDSLIVGKEEALVWWQEYAEEGNANAQYTLGKMYTTEGHGLNIEKDYKIAFSWFLKAAVQGHIKAQYEIAQAYRLGIGVTRDSNVAKTWYQQAADHGHSKAQNFLAGKVENPIGATNTYTSSSKNQEAMASPDVATNQQTEIQDSSLMATLAGSISVMFEDITLLDSITVGDGGDKYWTWWLGGIVLGFLTISFWLVVGTPLGVSSSWDRITSWRVDRELGEAKAILNNDRTATEDAMLAAAIEEFGEEHVKQFMDLDSPGLDEKIEVTNEPVVERRLPWGAHLTFLVMTLVGGLLAALSTGDLQFQFTLGEDFERLFGYGTHTWILLIMGGMLVGFGTRMGGGCSSGHGLSGCSRLQSGSLIGTASFFGTAIVVSLILEALV